MTDTIWTSATDSQRVAIIGLMLQVNWVPGEHYCKWCRQKLKIKPGETVKTIVTLAEEASVSRRVMEQAIRNLEKQSFLVMIPGMMRRGRGRCHRIVKIKNWERYQSKDLSGGDDTGAKAVNERLMRGDRYNKYNNITNKQERGDKSPSPSKAKKESSSNNSDGNKVLSTYHEAYKAKYGIAPAIDWGRSDLSTAKALIKMVGVEDACLIAAEYPHHKDGAKFSFVKNNATEILTGIKAKPKYTRISADD